MTRPGGQPWRKIIFARRKYGCELLADTGWIHEYQTFIRSDEPHRLDFHEILLVTRGSGRVWLDDRQEPVRPGRVFFTAPGQVRRWQVRTLDGVCLFFAADFLADFFQDALFLHTRRMWAPDRGSPALTLGRDDQRWLRARLGDMRRELGGIDEATPHVLRAALYEVLVRLDRLYAARVRPASATVSVRHAVRFRQLLDAHLGARRRVGDYAALLGLTPGHLNDLARRHLGRSAGTVIRERLAAEARRRLLHTDDPAARIAGQLGFDDPAYFSRFFRRETGVSPTRFRETIREKHQPRRD
ncbi:MAG TPA: helix-turn-helix domain-containing protein [Gammaproteobacteria bacterium]|nr:helix-turn-helix domain-containing protein [Gammaproteobacteria bacterium]